MLAHAGALHAGTRRRLATRGSEPDRNLVEREQDRVAKAERGVDRLAQQLSDRFAVLEGTRSEAGWDSLEAALAWSWDRLDAAEQDTLVACTLFDDSFDPDAAEHVGGEGAASRLTSLVDSAMVLVEGDVTPRLRLLTSVREFVMERAAPSEPRSGPRPAPPPPRK